MPPSSEESQRVHGSLAAPALSNSSGWASGCGRRPPLGARRRNEGPEWWRRWGADAEAFPLQLRRPATQQIPWPHLALQLSGLDGEVDFPLLRPPGPEGTALTPGGLGPGWLGQGTGAPGAPSGLSAPDRSLKVLTLGFSHTYQTL